MEKHKIVIICDVIMPIWSPMGRIAYKTASYLKDKYDISIISVESRGLRATGEEFDNIKVYTVGQWRYRWTEYLGNRCSKESNYIRKEILNWMTYALRIIGRLEATFIHIDNLWWFQKKVYKLLDQINQENKYDAIISFSAPIEAHIAAKRIKGKYSNVRWASFWLDLFGSQNYKLNVFTPLKKLKQIEKDLMETSDLVMTTPEIYRILKKRTSKEIYPIPYAISEDGMSQIVCTELKNRNELNFLCMGALYRKIRNPELLLRTFSGSKNTRFFLDLYVNGECMGLVRKYAERSNGKIRVHGLVDADTLKSRMYEADFLVNIENDTDECYPSKTLELVSYMKPIFDIGYVGREDFLLNKYPELIKVVMSDSEEDVLNKLNQYIDSREKIVINRADIENIYHENLEKNVSLRITGLIEEHLGI